MRTDDEGYSSYSYQRIYNGQTLLYFLHFYDEGLFYNGFWVVNDLETGYVETEGRVFIYNSENDYCVEVQISKKQIFCPKLPSAEYDVFPRTLQTTGTSGKGGTGNTTQISIWSPANHHLLQNPTKESQ